MNRIKCVDYVTDIKHSSLLNKLAHCGLESFAAQVSGAFSLLYFILSVSVSAEHKSECHSRQQTRLFQIILPITKVICKKKKV
jgi:hypothetical protein